MPAQEPSIEALDRAWAEAIGTLIQPAGPVAVLYSGGLDSSLIAWELRNRPETVLATVGLPGSSDLVAAADGSGRIGLPWVGTTLGEERLVELRAVHRSALAQLPPSRRSLFLAIAAAVLSAPPGRILCGQGADELFLGYAHFRELSPAEAEARSRRDLDHLLGNDWPWTQRLAQGAGRSVESPYLDPGFVRAAHRVPIIERLPADTPKACLRRLAARRGVPPELVGRPKRALQFGSGIDAWWRRRPVP